MKNLFIKPNVEWWPQSDWQDHIAKVARICYKSTGRMPDEELTSEEKKTFIHARSVEMCQRLLRSGHKSMFRHGTAYFFVQTRDELPSWLWGLLGTTPYAAFAHKGPHGWISTNYNFLLDHAKVYNMLKPYAVSESDFIDKAINLDCRYAIMLLRMTMVVTTQISTTRELNRTSPNAISEQSTRYVNMKKKGGISCAKPYWYNGGSKLQRCIYYVACKVAEWSYLALLKSGMLPQDARGVLPLDTYSIVAYTYSLIEWKHFLDIRFRGTTGKPHPNAKIVAEKIHGLILMRIAHVLPDFTI